MSVSPFSPPRGGQTGKLDLATALVTEDVKDLLNDYDYANLADQLFAGKDKFDQFRLKYGTLLTARIIMDQNGSSMIIDDRGASLAQQIQDALTRGAAALHLTYGDLSNVIWISPYKSIERYEPLNKPGDAIQNAIDRNLIDLFTRVLPDGKYHIPDTLPDEFVLGNTLAKNRRHTYQHLTEDYCLMYMRARIFNKDWLHEQAVGSLKLRGNAIIDDEIQLLYVLAQ